jgi:MGT family glycosyltransferase
VDVFIRIAGNSGYPCKENETYRFGEIAPRLMLPEIALSPEAFQLPDCPPEGRVYLGGSVDVERLEPRMDVELSPEKPLILCSLGTNALYYPHSGRFFRAVIGAAALRSDLQFVLHAGKYGALPRMDSMPPNLVIREEIPQLSLLRRASVMVHHGGTSSIRECIHFEVPMVIVPGLRDQPGNAVRASHHGLAVTAAMSQITPEQLLALIDRAMSSDSIRRNLAQMKQKIATEQGLERSIRLIEETAGRTT